MTGRNRDVSEYRPWQWRQHAVPFLILCKSYSKTLTGKLVTMLCHFQDLQAESSPVLSEAEVRKRFNLTRTGAIKAVSAVRYRGCDDGYVQYFCRMREEQLRLYLIFANIKMHMYSKQSTLSHKEIISTCCHHSVLKIFLNFWALIITAFPPVPPRSIKITVSWCRETANKSNHP